ncbi:hypothetical protein A2U01_0100617, partial [Trifolium medium]|nr:hypothetical protein [Trifolium medium]
VHASVAPVQVSKKDLAPVQQGYVQVQNTLWNFPNFFAPVHALDAPVHDFCKSCTGSTCCMHRFKSQF